MALIEASSNPGTRRRVIILVSMAVLILNEPRGGGRKRCSFSSILIPISAKLGRFGLSNAFSLEVFTFVDRHPRTSLSWKNMQTSDTVSLLANIVAIIKFFLASLYGSRSGI